MGKRACLGCGAEAVRGAYCERCASRDKVVSWDKPPKRKRGYVKARDSVRWRDQRWRELAARQLRLHPICAACAAEGKSSPAQVADHIRPWHWFPEWRYRIENLQSLCRKHHAVKSGKERHGYLVSYVDKKVMTLTPEKLAECKKREREEISEKKRLSGV